MRFVWFFVIFVETFIKVKVLISFMEVEPYFRPERIVERLNFGKAPVARVGLAKLLPTVINTRFDGVNSFVEKVDEGFEKLGLFFYRVHIIGPTSNGYRNVAVANIKHNISKGGVENYGRGYLMVEKVRLKFVDNRLLNGSVDKNNLYSLNKGDVRECMILHHEHEGPLIVKGSNFSHKIPESVWSEDEFFGK